MGPGDSSRATRVCAPLLRVQCAVRSPQGLRATESSLRPLGRRMFGRFILQLSTGTDAASVRLQAPRRRRLQLVTTATRGCDKVRPKGRTAARYGPRGRTAAPQAVTGARKDARKPMSPRHLHAVANRRTRPPVTIRDARSRKAREPPRSMRWCQRRCDRGIRARDPDVC